LLSNGFLPSNLFEGGLVNLGSYEQCLRTSAVNRVGEKTIRGQYCSLHFKPPVEAFKSLLARFNEVGELMGRENPLTRTSREKFASTDFRVGICTPSTCSEEDLQVVTRKLLGQYGFDSTVRSCRTDSPKNITKLQAASMAVLGTVVLTVVAATLTEWVVQARAAGTVKRKDGTALGTLLYFSALSNTRYLLRTENTEKNRPLLFLGGFKVVLILWVIYGHSYIMVQLEFAQDLFEIGAVFRKVASQIIPNGFLSVSTFLYLRLTIPVIGVILGTFLLPLLVDGPADEEFVGSEVQGCITNWWTVFVQANNFNSMDDMLMTSLGIFCYSVFFGYLLYLCFEAPGYHLQRILFNIPTSSKESREKSDDHSGTEVDIEKASCKINNSDHGGKSRNLKPVDNPGFETDAEKSRL
ncbi:hypothetical protein V5799_029784, partial [Amblyomma americanum]